MDEARSPSLRGTHTLAVFHITALATWSYFYLFLLWIGNWNKMKRILDFVRINMNAKNTRWIKCYQHHLEGQDSMTKGENISSLARLEVKSQRNVILLECTRSAGGSKNILLTSACLFLVSLGELVDVPSLFFHDSCDGSPTGLLFRLVKVDGGEGRS